MTRRELKRLMCRNDLALAGAIVLLAVAGFTIAGAILTERMPNPTWDTFWDKLPSWYRVTVGIAAGLLISTGIGWRAVPWFQCYAGRYLPREDDEKLSKYAYWQNWERDKRVPDDLTGSVERLAFTFFVMAYPSVAVAGMFGWMGLKMAANWNKDVLPKEPKDSTDPTKTDDVVKARIVWNRYAFRGLLTGFVSMCFAWVGGMVARLVMDLDINP